MNYKLLLYVLIIIFAIFAVYNLVIDRDPNIGAVGEDKIVNECELACEKEDAFVFCCNAFDLGSDGELVECSDPELGVECNVDCANYDC